MINGGGGGFIGGGGGCIEGWGHIDDDLVEFYYGCVDGWEG